MSHTIFIISVFKFVYHFHNGYFIMFQRGERGNCMDQRTHPGVSDHLGTVFRSLGLHSIFSSPTKAPHLCANVCMYVHRAIRAQPVGAAVTCYPVDPRGQAQGKYHYLWSHLTSPDPKLKMCICCFFNCLILPIDPGARCGESLLALEGRESSKLTFLFH